jgi:nucleotidyltransferase-like protein
LGSLARGEADEFSDIDLLLTIRDGDWERAWSRRHTLSAGALYVWDEEETGRELGKHGWLTRDFVLVECPHTTRAGAHRLAEPFVVIAVIRPLLTSFRDVRQYHETNYGHTLIS